MEDGAFKLDGITIGNGCTFGVNSYIHYGIDVGDGAVVETASLMKSEEIPVGATFGDNPARELSTRPAPSTLGAAGFALRSRRASSSTVTAPSRPVRPRASSSAPVSGR
ncbi:hypothetical protein M3684_14765 [Kocuria rosea]|nr:hypothetical protein [Kocuria rosea]